MINVNPTSQQNEPAPLFFESSARERKSVIEYGANGLRHVGSLLSLDATSSEGLNFVSSALKIGELAKSTSESGQNFTSEQAIGLQRALGKPSESLLVCQQNRPFSIGNLSLELLPSGSMLGACSLHIESNKDSVLYAPNLQPSNLKVCHKMRVKPAENLVLGCFHPEPRSTTPSRKKERERLLDAVSKSLSSGSNPVVMCNPYSTAAELTNFFSEEKIPVATHNMIFKINRVYASHGGLSGKFSFYSQKYTRQKVILFPKVDRPFRANLPAGDLFMVDETLVSKPLPPDNFRPVVERFVMNNTADATELRKIIQQVNPNQIYLFGPYTKPYQKMLSSLDIPTVELEPEQQELLF